jgi:UDP-4-amino-4,6-dideoxy-N-acetyl-beta-L-altrosamine transaminase
LHIACLALGLGSGDRLWTSPITFVASANCGLYCGAEVDFVDIEPATGLMSTAALAKKLKFAESNGTLPKVVVPVHLGGNSCNMEVIGQLAVRYGFAVIEDASHAIGGSYQGAPVGNCRFSEISVFSFHPVKIITTGEGGLATTNDPAVADELQRLRSHGIERQAFNRESPGPWYYEQQKLGFNYRLTDLQAALGLSQLQHLDAFVDRRRVLIDRYRAAVTDWPVAFLDEPAECRSAYHLAVLKITSATPAQHRELFVAMRARQIGVQLHYWPIHLQPYYQHLGFQLGQFPNSEIYAHTCLSLPLFPDLNEGEQDRVLKALDESLQEQGLL